MSTRKINVTKDYSLFNRSPSNRPLDLRKHTRLRKSMEKYGFIHAFPIVCIRDKNKRLIIKDGQHRFAIAETLGLPIYWVEVLENEDFDIPEINNTARTWTIEDFAMNLAERGKESYQEAINFSVRHKISLSMSFALLAGTTGWTNVNAAFFSGGFVVKDREWAETVATVYSVVVSIAPRLKNQRFMEACMGVCRVPEFDTQRFIESADKYRENLHPYTTREAFLGMIETIYNHHRMNKSKLPLKFMATQAMQERMPGKQNKQTKQG